LLLYGCTFQKTGGKSAANSPNGEAAALVAGKPLFEFAPERVTELSIQKNDPYTGDRWAATLVPMPSETSEVRWVFRSSGERSLGDSKADGKLILHLLDTLSTLRFAEKAPEGPRSGTPASLASHGMDPPLFALRWKVPRLDGDATALESELWIGSVAARPTNSPDNQSGFARIVQREGMRLEPAPVVIASGAAIQMLGILTGFEVLRDRRLVAVPLDDVDEMSFRVGVLADAPASGPPSFFAQRVNSAWGDAKNQPFPEERNRLVEDFAHLRIREFIDDAAKAQEFSARARSTPGLEAVLKDRKNRPTTVLVTRMNQDWVAFASDRPGGVFLLHNESERFLTKLGAAQPGGKKQPRSADETRRTQGRPRS
jgi:hypothetical protein